MYMNYQAIQCVKITDFKWISNAKFSRMLRMANLRMQIETRRNRFHYKFAIIFFYLVYYWHRPFPISIQFTQESVLTRFCFSN